MAISENVTIGSSIIRVLANDPDHGSNSDLAFTLTGGDGIFVINETTGRFGLFFLLIILVEILRDIKPTSHDRKQILHIYLDIMYIHILQMEVFYYPIYIYCRVIFINR